VNISILTPTVENIIRSEQNMKKDNGNEVTTNKKTKKLEIILISISALALIASVVLIILNNNLKKDFYGDSKGNKIESNGSADGKLFLELLNDKNIGKEVNAVGFMNTYLSEDLTAGWLMTMPYLRDTEVQSGEFDYVTLIAKNGQTLEFSEYAVTVNGILQKDEAGNWYIVDCEIKTFSDGKEGKLEQFNQLVYMGYFREFTSKVNEVYYILNEGGHGSHSYDTLGSIIETLESSYSDKELMHQAAHIAEALYDLYKKVDEAQHDGSLEAKIEQFNEEAQQVYDNFYHHMESFGINN